MRRKVDLNRCDHCGKWVAECQGFTLYNMANGHPESESVHVCEKCSGETVDGEYRQTYTPEYWYAWLDKRFPPGGHWEAGRYIPPTKDARAPLDWKALVDEYGQHG